MYYRKPIEKAVLTHYTTQWFPDCMFLVIMTRPPTHNPAISRVKYVKCTVKVFECLQSGLTWMPWGQLRDSLHYSNGYMGPLQSNQTWGWTVDRALWLDATFFENPECTHEGHLFIDFTMATPASPKSIAVECQGHFGWRYSSGTHGPSLTW